ncbi:E3 ubiquitin-protein ligase TRIM47 [Protopterus annectens]|uniref:E3 ubiquitin-protein ligase TRIM47 n=1 Tax=Protopterus annectens TaxID=7888 RepID=UPI001CFB8473|nr:E3 ubiquitin-protein ligase TRIM47 [Protopterus annectens]
MTSYGTFFTKEQFVCSICLEVFRDPATIPCGHSFCIACLKAYWDRGDRESLYLCPICREVFKPRPALRRNNILKDVVEHFLSFQPEVSQISHIPTDDDIFCDFCTDVKQGAVKSCLVCMASYCEQHIQSHYQKAVLRAHKLVCPMKDFEGHQCKLHARPLEMFCRTDQASICYECLGQEHKNHETVTLEQERALKQEQLSKMQNKLEEQIQQVESNIQKIRQAMESLKISACLQKEDIVIKFSKLTAVLEAFQRELLQFAEDEEGAVLAEAEGRIRELEKKAAELKNNKHKLELLPKEEDSHLFLQGFQTLKVSTDCRHLPRFTANRNFHLTATDQVVSVVTDQLKDTCKNQMENLSSEVRGRIPFIRVPTMLRNPKTREDFLHYVTDLTLDPSSADLFLQLSEENKQAARTVTSPADPGTPAIGSQGSKVLCMESLQGERFYWEVEISNSWVGLGVTTQPTKDEETSGQIGADKLSWWLQWNGFNYIAQHSSTEVVIDQRYFNKIGMYLDCEAGTLTFYGVTNAMVCLHRFRVTCTQPLHPIFCLESQDSYIRICSFN